MIRMEVKVMEYSVSQLAKLSGVSARTLRYYDEINLLKPKRINSSGYRIYGQDEVDLLQQILYYRELEMSLEAIKAIVHSGDFNITEALKEHLVHLSRQKRRLEGLITSVEQSLQAIKGDIIMSDQAKFEAFKQEKLKKNEAEYGEEVRAKYGKDVVEASNHQFANVPEAEWQSFQKLEDNLHTKLKEATQLGDITSLLAQEVCDLHRKWLIFFWPEGHYDKQKHYNLSLMYVHDDRFKAYYEKIQPDAAEFLNKALELYTGQA